VRATLGVFAYPETRMPSKSFHLYLDSADLQKLQAQLPHPLVHGVTTNPTLLKRAGVSGEALPALLQSILALGVKQVQAQVTSVDARGMLEDAHRMVGKLGPDRLVVKIPATREGFRAGAQLSAEGIPVTYTAVYAIEQVLFAAQLGASYAAPYLGRLQDIGLDWLALLREMQQQVTGRGGDMRLLIASVRKPEAFRAAIAAGVEAATISPKLFSELLGNELTLAAERVFIADAASLRQA
jgi:transaldolase